MKYTSGRTKSSTTPRGFAGDAKPLKLLSILPRASRPGVKSEGAKMKIVLKTAMSTLFIISIVTGCHRPIEGAIVANENTVELPALLFLSITTPLDSSALDKKEILVRGAVISKAQEVGVRVNGEPATVSGKEFVANRVPVGEGNSVVKAEAIDTNGGTAVTSVTVNRTPSRNPLRLAVNIDSGIGPLETVLRIDGVAGTAPDISYTGPGNVEFLDCSSPDSCKIKMTTEGVYAFTVTAVGYDGKTYSDRIAITVLDRAKLDALLKAKWEGMKAAVINGNLELGLSYFAYGSRDKYRAIFMDPSRNITARLSEITKIEIYSIKGMVAQGGGIRIESDGAYAYPLTFVRDQNGMWKIMGF